MNIETTNESPLKGKRALVTGGAKRIGRACVLAMARAGADVVIHYGSSAEEAEQTAEDARAHGGEATCIQADLSDLNATQAMAESLVKKLPIDVLVNSASIFPTDTFHDLRMEKLESNVRVNTMAPYILAKVFAEQGRAGHIVNFLDTRVVDYDKQHVAYHLSKRMLRDLTRQMATEYAPHIQVNAIAPGLILPPPDKDDSYLESLKDTNPLQRVGHMEDITGALMFFLTNTFVTGQTLFIDGGRHMKGDFYG